MKFNQEIPKKVGEAPAEILPKTIESSVDTKSTRFITDLISKTKEFLRSKAIDLKLGAMVIIAMGSMEVVQAQEGDISKFRDAIQDVRLGKDKVSNVVDSFYDKYKKENIDSTYFISEHFQTQINGEITESINNIPKLIEVGLNDTISLGDVHVKNFCTYMSKSVSEWKDGEQNLKSEDVHKILQSFKITENNIKENGKDSLIEDRSIIEYGETKAQAIIGALYYASSLKRSFVTVLSQNISSNENRNGKPVFSNDSFIHLNTIESDEKFHNVRVIVKKIPNKDSHGHHKKSITKSYYPNGYSAEVIYKE